jgi:hypothetical protein
MDRIPKYAPEEINIMAVVDRQVKTDAAIKGLTASVNEMITGDGGRAWTEECVKIVTESVDRRLVDLQEGIQRQLDHLSTACSTLSKQVVTVHPEAETRVKTTDIDCSLNVIVTGIDEDKDNNVWKQKVDAVLHYIAGRDVCVTDAIRVGGPYKLGRKRPILVKLASAWDRRIIVGNTRKLADSSEYSRKIYVSPDEPLNVRRQKTLKRLKERAMRDHKSCEVTTEGALLIDNEVVFTLQNGYVSRNVVLASQYGGS